MRKGICVAVLDGGGDHLRRHGVGDLVDVT